jgi:nitrogen fixation/metabolism regulation signal transduction histidine kinase
MLIILMINIPVFLFIYHRYVHKSNPIIKNKLHETMRESYELGEYTLNQIKQDFLQKTNGFIFNAEFLEFQRKFFNQHLDQQGYNLFQNSPAVQNSGFDAIEIRSDHQEKLFTFYRTSQTKIQTLIRDSINNDGPGALSQVRYFEHDHILIVQRQILFTNQRYGLLITAMTVPPAVAVPYLRIKTAYLYLADIEQRERIAVDRRTHDMIVLYGIFFVIQTALMGLFSWLFFRPVRLLAKETGMLAGQRENFVLSGVKRNDEIGRISRSIQTIIDNAGSQQLRMLDLEKTALWREIAQRLAHEIKNPLTPIQLTLQQIKDAYQNNDPRYPEILNECYTIIQEELNRLSVLTKEFSDFARLPDFHYQLSSLNKIIRDVSFLYHHEPIELKLDDGVPDIYLDIDAIKQVFINLFDNAFAATDTARPNQILLTSRLDGDNICVVISDRGKGIPKDHLQKIFEPHFSTKSANMGLGLAIVKTILDHHRAAIDVESVERSGTTFTIRFQLQNPLFADESN